jgi:flagellar basal-body rod protein FlgF
MSDGLTIAEIAMLNDLTQMKALSHNLANVNTTGYKQEIARTEGFHDVMEVLQSKRMNVENNAHIKVALPHMSNQIDTSSGALKFTGNPMDLAMEDNTYLTVKTNNGLAYTRQGDLHINNRGMLVSSMGDPVMGKGGEIRLTSDKPVIDSQGKILIDQQVVAELKLVKFASNSEITSMGNAMYTSSLPVYEVTKEENMVHQGYMEASNVNMTDQMVKMIETTRHFESIQRVVRGYDDMLDNAINIIGDL